MAPSLRVPSDSAARRAVVRQGMSVALATSVYGVSYGALAVASGLDVWQVSATALLIFSGASQFALIGVLGGGGGIGVAIAASSLLGVRNSVYGLPLKPILAPRGWRRFVVAQLTIDETAAVAVAQSTVALGRLGFWVTGIGTFAGWNITVLIGALAGNAIGDPKQFGLDAAASGAFLALLWPRLKRREPVVVAIAGALVTVALVPVVPVGLPVVAAAAIAAGFGFLRAPRTVKAS